MTMQEAEKRDFPKWLNPTEAYVDEYFTLYKYRAFSEQSLSLLIDAELFCASPAILNDPYDSQIDVKAALSEAVQWQKGHNPRFENTYDQALDMLQSSKADKWISSALDMGICSFSSRSDNTLMWSHYAQEHKGFCIGISPLMIKKDHSMGYMPENVGISSVRYTDGNPMLPLVQRFNNMFADGHYEDDLSGVLVQEALDAAVTTKHLAWVYESEMRFIHHEGQNTVPIERESICEIVFGSRMPERHRNTLRRLAESSGLSSVKFYEMRKSMANLSFDKVACD